MVSIYILYPKITTTSITMQRSLSFPTLNRSKLLLKKGKKKKKKLNENHLHTGIGITISYYVRPLKDISKKMQEKCNEDKFYTIQNMDVSKFKLKTDDRGKPRLIFYKDVTKLKNLGWFEYRKVNCKDAKNPFTGLTNKIGCEYSKINPKTGKPFKKRVTTGVQQFLWLKVRSYKEKIFKKSKCMEVKFSNADFQKDFKLFILTSMQCYEAYNISLNGITNYDKKTDLITINFSTVDEDSDAYEACDQQDFKLAMLF